MKLFIFSFFYISFFMYCFANDFSVQGTKENALGTSCISFKSVFTHNPAWYAHQREVGIGMYYQYHFSDVPIVHLSFLYPLKEGKTLQTSFSSFSTEFYKNQQITVGYGQKIGEKLSLGMVLTTNFIHIPNYQQNQQIQLGLGTNYQLTKALNIAFTGNVFVLNKVQIERELTTLHNTMQLGILYHQKKYDMVVEISQTTHQKLIAKVGLNYFLYDHFSLQTGINTQGIWGGGFQLLYKNYQIGMSANYQYLLGLTPHFSITYELK